MAGLDYTGKRMTAEAFLDWMDAQPEGARYELHGGEIVGMVNERSIHARGKTIIASQLHAQLRGKGPRRAYAEGLAVRFADEAVVYPDVMVDCSEPEPDARFVTKPVLVVEILSPSTRGADIGLKAPRYIGVPGLVALVMIDLDGKQAIILRPSAPNVPEIAGRDATPRFELPGGAVTLDLAEVFAD